MGHYVWAHFLVNNPVHSKLKEPPCQGATETDHRLSRPPNQQNLQILDIFRNKYMLKIVYEENPIIRRVWQINWLITHLLRLRIWKLHLLLICWTLFWWMTRLLGNYWEVRAPWLTGGEYTSWEETWGEYYLTFLDFWHESSPVSSLPPSAQCQCGVNDL